MIRALVRARPLLEYPAPWYSVLIGARAIRSKAYEADFDPDELEEARKWRASFNEGSVPRGQTTYSRSSGPGGQHVNKTESKATTFWTISELSKGMPSLVQSALRSSKYYSRRNDSITIQAQTQRSRTANTDENRQKLIEEILGMYKERVPAATGEEKVKKYEALEKSAREERLKAKKQQSSKKAFRKGKGFED